MTVQWILITLVFNFHETDVDNFTQNIVVTLCAMKKIKTVWNTLMEIKKKREFCCLDFSRAVCKFLIKLNKSISLNMPL